jgi:acyl-CoA synthetase (AMP-forming)/AMP-acid ligase II
VLSEHAAVAQIAVLGVPDPVLGEIGCAFVVPAAGAPTDAPTDAEALLAQLRSFCREALADYKAPDRLVVVDALPLTSVGKVDKRALGEDAGRAPGGYLRGVRTQPRSRNQEVATQKSQRTQGNEANVERRSA